MYISASEEEHNHSKIAFQSPSMMLYIQQPNQTKGQ
ncbi:hypothetical protein NC653_032067 [Populus alba x Populus x berolinensis]|uniref:Uncharacterized protein n=1 Tax=Populus alba x Populus x berolinensis TaxID=444605 RepID=A0AAD6PYM9_9ROSI|nr:hypothetical protein NC653_032067 [Populus alba x Populus x berolinensis]